jgi:hypothetical protein
MDVAQLGAAIASLLAPYLPQIGQAAANTATELAPEAVQAVYQAIRRKFAADHDADAERTLDALAARPTSDARQAALAEVVAEKAQADAAFGQELARLANGAMREPGVVQQLINVYGQARVGKITSIGSVRGDVTI